MGLRRKVAIVGIGETQVGALPDKTCMELYTDAAVLAMEDAGIERDEIDGLLSCYTWTDGNLRHHVRLAEALGLPPRKYTATMLQGGAGPTAALIEAAAAVEAGLCDVVLVAAGDNMLSGWPSRDEAVKFMGTSDRGHVFEFEGIYSIPMPGYFGLLAQRYMHEHNVTSEQLASVAVTMREHASRNPNAYMREPITVDDVLNSKMIATPLHILDCAVIADGAGAYIVTTAERAKRCRRDPVFLLGAGQAYGYYHIADIPNITDSLARVSAEDALREARVARGDVDFAAIYDCFTPTVLLVLEGLGFAKEGQAGAFVAEGNLRLGGSLPTNTHGGLLSMGHPGLSANVFHITEAVRQLRGDCGERQVANCEVALVHGIAGLESMHATAILGN